MKPTSILYLDESQQYVACDYTVVAGFRGTESQWAKFIVEWSAALGNRKTLHMGSLRWNSPRASVRVRPLLEKLGRIPYDCGLIPVYGGVREEDYLDLVPEEAKGDRKITAYTMCLGEIFTTLIETLPGHERIKIVCEAQDQSELAASRLFKVFQRMAAQDARHPYLLSIEYARNLVMFEPADFLAFALMHNLTNGGSKKDLWCRPIHGPNRELSCRPGIWMDRRVARETMMLIKADINQNAGRSLLKEVIATVLEADRKENISR